MNTNTAKGFNDYLGKDALKRKKIIQIIENAFSLYGFEPAETPIIENREFVLGEDSNAQNDEAVRDVFKLQDRGKRNLALRYEFTFQLKRISKKQKLPFKRYQIGYVFRDEPIKQGRTRQFIQADADIVGSSIKDEAELFAISKNVLDKLNIDFEIQVNNRKLLNEILVEQKIPESAREQVIREIDKIGKLEEKEILNNLKKFKAEKILKIFNQKESYFEKYSYYKEIKELKKICKEYNVSVNFSPSLARGLSYYNSTIFEIKTKKLNVSIAGGGSYLIDKIQSTGISLGLEPLFLIANPEKIDNIKFLIVSLSKDKEAISFASELRQKNISTQLLLDKSPSRALEYANSKEIENVIFVGDEEIKSGKFKIKNLKTGKESLLSRNNLLSLS